MSTSKTWPGGGTGASPTSYSIPAAGELNWASLSSFLIALADGAQSTTFQKYAVRKAIATPVTVSATTDCIVVTDLSVAGAVAVNLPAGANKQSFVIVDGKGDALTNNITITPNGAETIAGGANAVLVNNREAIWLVYNSGDTDWKIVGRMSGGGILSNPMTTAGDIIYGGASGTPTRLAAGAANTVLRAGATPSYALIANANVDAAAAIAGTKISPAFGTQNVSATGTLALTGVATITAASSQLIDLTGSGTTDLKITSNNTTGTSKLSIGHSSDNDAGYMQYNVAAGTISWGTNGSTDTMILSSASALQVGNGSNSLPAFSFTGDPDTGMYNAGANQIGFASGGTRRLTIDSNGLLFQNGSTALNYYDEGSWTAGVTINGVAQTLSVNTCRYIRTGRFVFCTFEIEFSKTADVGAVLFTGLPFTVGATFGTVTIGLAGGIIYTSMVSGYASPSGTSWIMTNLDAAGGGRTNWTNANLGASTVLYGTVSYRA